MEIPSKYLPSKTYLEKLGTIVLVVVIIISIKQIYTYGKAYIKLRNETASLNTIIVKDLAMQDVDQNGIPDWQDNLSPELENTVGVSQTQGAQINETDQFARDLLTTAATISQSGQLSNEGAESIADDVSKEIAAVTVGKTYTSSDIKIVTDTKKAQDEYIKQVTKILNVQYPLDIDNSVVILEASLDSGNQTGLTALNPIIERYEKLIDVFLKLPVPGSFAPNHLAFINVLGKVHGSVETMKNIFVNPVMAMGVIINYSATMGDLLGYIAAFTTKVPYSTLATDDSSGN